MTRGRPLQVYFVALGVLFIVVGAAAGAYVYVQSSSDAQQAAIADANFAANKASTHIASGLDTIRTTSEATVGNMPAMQAIFANPARCQLGNAPVGAFETGRHEYVRSNGLVICSSKPGVAGAVYAGQSWLQSAEPMVIAPTADPLDGRPVAVLSYPVPGLGFLVWFEDLTPVASKLASQFSSANNQLEFLVVSGDGKSILSRSIEASKWAGTPFTSSGGAVERNDVDGISRWYAQTTVANAGWNVYVGADRALAMATVARLQEREFGIIVMGVVLTELELFVVFRQVVRPMTSLAAAVRASRGSGARVPVAGPAEVARLGQDINDLTASLKQSEMTYERLFEGSPLPVIVVVPATGKIVHVNDAAVMALGYSRDEFQAMDGRSLSAPRDDEERQLIAQARATLAPTLRMGPLTLRKKDGTDMRVMVTGYDVDEDRVPTRVQIVEDVTEREKIERQMQQAQRLESLGQLAGGVAHDFNNLLTVMLNVTSALRSRAADSESSRDIERLDQAAQSASRLTRQLLAFARQEVLPRSVVDVDRQLADLKELLARTIGSHVRLTMELDPDAWPVLMDRGHLEQIVINLSVNARDAMPNGGNLVISAGNFIVDELYAQSRAGVRPGRYLRLQVSDSGTGMDKATLDHAFEPFFTTKPVGQGTGLGLATVYGIVKQLDGHVSIYSEVGHGTTVTVLLPATTQATAVEGPAEQAETRPGTGTVLVVEDYGDLRELFDEILTAAGYHVLVAADGSEGLELAQRHKGKIDVLLTDVVMPNMLGTELALRLLAAHPDMRVLFMSGHSQPVIAGASPLPPNATLLQKPFMESELLEKLSQVLAAAPVDLRR